MVRGASRCIRYVATTIESFGSGIAGGSALRVVDSAREAPERHVRGGRLVSRACARGLDVSAGTDKGGR